MLVARIVSGIGMGFVNSTVPVIQAEFSPKSSRGRFVCMQLSTLNFGMCRPRIGWHFPLARLTRSNRHHDGLLDQLRIFYNLRGSRDKLHMASADHYAMHLLAAHGGSDLLDPRDASLARWPR